MNALQRQLFDLQDLKYREFHSKLMPGIEKRDDYWNPGAGFKKFCKRIPENRGCKAFSCGTSASVL